MITASGLHRALKCEGSTKLPQAVDVSSPQASRGTLVHSWIETYLNGKALPEDASIDPSFIAWLTWWNSVKSEYQYEGIEQAYEYDLYSCTGKAIACSQREYPAKEDCIYGTADYVGIDGDFKRVVMDWKTGQYHDSYDTQMKFLMMASKADYALLVFISDEGVTTHRIEAEHLYLPSSFEWSFNAGDHCQWCKAQGCPIKNNALTEIQNKQISTQYDLVEWLKVKKLVADRVEELDDQAKALVDANGGYIDLGNGKAYKCTTATRKTLDRKLAEAELGSLSRFEKESTYNTYKVVNA